MMLHCKAILGRGQPGLLRWIMWSRIFRPICWPAVQRTTTELRMPRRQVFLLLTYARNLIESYSWYWVYHLNHSVMLPFCVKTPSWIYNSQPKRVPYDFPWGNRQKMLWREQGDIPVQWKRAGCWSNDRSCTWGMIHNTIHLISPLWPSITLQCRIVA